MKVAFLRYIIAFACIFTLLQGTGVPLSAAFSEPHKQSLASTSNSDEDDATSRAEKEVELKELYADASSFIIVAPCVILQPAANSILQQNHHLAWIAPVPTPPPNSLS